MIEIVILVVDHHFLVVVAMMIGHLLHEVVAIMIDHHLLVVVAIMIDHHLHEVVVDIMIGPHHMIDPRKDGWKKGKIKVPLYMVIMKVITYMA
jgi:hypothetical protein